MLLNRMIAAGVLGKRRETRLLYDPFTVTGALNTRVPQVGNTWSVKVGTWNNVAAGAVSIQAGSHSAAISECGAADVDIEATLNVLAAVNTAIIVRSNSDASNRIALILNSDNDACYFYRYDSLSGVGQFTNMSAVGTPSFDAGVHAVKVYMYGTSYRLFVDDVLTHVMTYASYLTNTYHGIGCYLAAAGNACYFNDITVRASTGWKRFATLGDSITAAGGGWQDLTRNQYNGSKMHQMNHAVGSQSIMTHMDAQTVAAASDDADIIIIALGTNDGDNAGITAEYQENLTEIMGTNPRARVYGMGILPRTGGARDANNPRIAAACAAAGATYWNTDGWIDPATDTSDGVHPTPAGHQKIATQVMALL